MKIKFYLIFFALIGFSGIRAQTIQLHFPHFAGRSYIFVIFQGDRIDTIAKDKITFDGRVTLQVPAKYKGYAGMARWLLTDKGGGGLDMVVNNEDFSVECLEATPNEQNIKFTGSEENRSMNVKYHEQQKIFRKVEAMNTALESYTANDALYPIFKQEQKRLEQQYDSFRVELGKNTTYTARFRRITDFTLGIGDKLYKTEEEKALGLNDFITNQMDWLALYTSHHWGGVIASWMEMHEKVLKNDVLLLANTHTILARLPNDKLYTEFVAELVNHLTKLGKINLLTQLTGEIKHSGRLLHTNGALEMFIGVQKGDKIPSIVGLKKDNLSFTGGTIVLFYESSCPHCDTTITKLKANYATIVQKNIRLISISSDMNAEIYNSVSSSFPWKDKLCDYKGLTGINFKNYGIIGTPTLFYVDNKGIVQGRFARWEELVKRINQKRNCPDQAEI